MECKYNTNRKKGQQLNHFGPRVTWTCTKSLLNYGFTQKKKGDGVTEGQRKQSADEIQIYNMH